MLTCHLLDLNVTWYFISEGLVTGRGCSTKRSSYKKCETHSYGKVSQKFCYCSKSLCNHSNMMVPSSLLALVTSSFLLSSGTVFGTASSSVAMISLEVLRSVATVLLRRTGGDRQCSHQRTNKTKARQPSHQTQLNQPTQPARSDYLIYEGS